MRAKNAAKKTGFECFRFLQIANPVMVKDETGINKPSIPKVAEKGTGLLKGECL